MKLLALLSAAAGVSALPQAQQAQANYNSFSVMSARSGSPVHLLPLNAASGGFYLGLQNASSYCPDQVAELGACPPGTETVFDAGANSLDVSVPGGQQVYIAPSGALAFTQPHSAYVPAGSVVGAFSYSQTAGTTFGYWTLPNSGLIACPVPAAAAASSSAAPSATPAAGSAAATASKWQVFAAWSNATVPSGNVGDCLGFDALAVGRNGSAAAWEYI
ncbi:hypothetical protein ASPACDRAFT_80400 [Aspergillus aculeatus ATCC 16872]|uniref:IgE-binding protein n=1 Tax=Aspergillus aculeatus (strain ATCC 16872 / CBS 172.66 / WB 5094) TaxID=690307 RepID=A0A1L9WMW8_ASPA1|nr:uncharacterized protein ASPACDRAFT_80400 [Aspergillus aculeatus ATCC 16872]OJJ97529.1 hypothetical protein ASPACDRAFT_80400 [Aspergillus aculeatus ATCC 16872]